MSSLSPDEDYFTQIKSKYNICATKCCLCHKTLTDPSSIEYGIGPICRKNNNYDDAPALDPNQLTNAIEAINAIFAEEISTQLIEKIKIGSASNCRQLAKLTIYYASSLIGTATVGQIIQCIRLLIALGYDQLAICLLGKSYGHWVWTEEEDNSISQLYYKGPYNIKINEYLRKEFKGQWDKTKHHWQLQGNRLDCIAMLINHELGILPVFPHLSGSVGSQPLPQKIKLEIKNEEMKNEIDKKIGKNVILTQIDQMIMIESPFNYNFKNKVKIELKGTWDSLKKKWIVDVKYFDKLKQLISEHYPTLKTINK